MAARYVNPENVAAQGQSFYTGLHPAEYGSGGGGAQRNVYGAGSGGSAGIGADRTGSDAGRAWAYSPIGIRIGQAKSDTDRIVEAIKALPHGEAEGLRDKSRTGPEALKQLRKGNGQSNGGQNPPDGGTPPDNGTPPDDGFSFGGFFGGGVDDDDDIIDVEWWDTDRGGSQSSTRIGSRPAIAPMRALPAPATESMGGTATRTASRPTLSLPRWTADTRAKMDARNERDRAKRSETRELVDLGKGVKSGAYMPATDALWAMKGVASSLRDESGDDESGYFDAAVKGMWGAYAHQPASRAHSRFR